jgi:hypothetical protein
MTQLVDHINRTTGEAQVQLLGFTGLSEVRVGGVRSVSGVAEEIGRKVSGWSGWR